MEWREERICVCTQTVPSDWVRGPNGVVFLFRDTFRDFWVAKLLRSLLVYASLSVGRLIVDKAVRVDCIQHQRKVYDTLVAACLHILVHQVSLVIFVLRWFI